MGTQWSSGTRLDGGEPSIYSSTFVTPFTPTHLLQGLHDPISKYSHMESVSKLIWGTQFSPWQLKKKKNQFKRLLSEDQEVEICLI